MRRTGRIQVPVEPLDEERLTNLERRLVIGVSEMSARPVRAPHRYLAFAGAAMAVVAAGVIGWKLHGGATAQVATAAAVDHEDHLAVKTDAERATLALDDATITSDPASAFDLTRGNGRVVVQMARGKLELAVQHRAGRVLVIRAGDTEIEDVGTRFSVDYDGKDHVDVRVTEGEVTVTRHQQVVHVTAGNAWTTATGLVAIAELERARTPAIAAIDTPPAPAPVAAETRGRHAAVPDVETRRTAAIAAAHPATATIDVQPRTRPAPAPADPYVDLRLAIRKVPIEFDPRIDGHTDAMSQIAKLKKVAYSATMGPDASHALYQIAVLLDHPLDQGNEALHTLDWYFRRFTGGKEMHAALWLRVRILCTRAIDDECRKAAYSYQHEVETGAAAEVAIRITNAQ